MRRAQHAPSMPVLELSGVPVSSKCVQSEVVAVSRWKGPRSYREVGPVPTQKRASRRAGHGTHGVSPKPETVSARTYVLSECHQRRDKGR